MEEIKNEISKHFHGVVQVLSTMKEYAVDTAWAVGAVIALVVYPLAISISEDRVMKN